MMGSPWFTMLVGLVLACYSQAAVAVSVKLPYGERGLVPSQPKAKSELYDWYYQLDNTAPMVSTIDQVVDVSTAYNGTVRVERINGTMMIIDHAQMKQVATLVGSVADWATSNYPSDAATSNTALVNDMKNAAADWYPGAYPGSPANNGVHATGNWTTSLDSRGVCSGCFLVGMCNFLCKRAAICVLVFCVTV